MTQEQKTIYINYFDGIDPLRVKFVMAMLAEIVTKEKPDVLYFLFSSGGGSVDAGIVLYNFLKGLPVKIIMHNTGVINSIANVIFLAGKERYAAKHSSFLFHGIAMGFPANPPLSLKQVKEKQSSLLQDESKLVGIISENTSLSESKLRDFFDTGEAVDVNFAKANGVIHEIKEPSIHKDAPLMSININVNTQ